MAAFRSNLGRPGRNLFGRFARAKTPEGGDRHSFHPVASFGGQEGAHETPRHDILDPCVHSGVAVEERLLHDEEASLGSALPRKDFAERACLVHAR